MLILVIPNLLESRGKEGDFLENAILLKKQTNRDSICQNVDAVKPTLVIISICSSIFFSITFKPRIVLTSKTIFSHIRK
jgi:predicted membrane protein